VISKGDKKIYYIIDNEYNKFIVESIVWNKRSDEGIDWNDIELDRNYKIIGYGTQVPIFEIYPKIIEIRKIQQ